MSYIIVSFLLVAAATGLVFLVDRRRWRAFEKAKAEQIREENRPLKVWICRYCGFMSLMKDQMCTWCGVQRPEEFVYRTISGKDFAAQLQKSMPKPHTEGSAKSV